MAHTGSCRSPFNLKETVLRGRVASSHLRLIRRPANTVAEGVWGISSMAIQVQGPRQAFHGDLRTASTVA